MASEGTDIPFSAIIFLDFLGENRILCCLWIKSILIRIVVGATKDSIFIPQYPDISLFPPFI